tara:strand:- start:2667 stop:3311 length:645 start_codon:yes stop_codon:yes gene_type:complete
MPSKTPQHTSLAAALAAAQGEMGNAHKNSTNPHFRSSYADLASLRDAVIPVLSRHGIALVQLADGDGSSVTVTTRIMGHGESMDCGSLTIPVGGAKNIPQAMGSAITYARRYQIGAVAGVASTVDDDGNALDGVRAQRTIPAKPSPAQEARHILQSKIGCDTKEKAEAVIRYVSDGSIGAADLDQAADTILGLLNRAWEAQGYEWPALLELAKE